jgi:hypothetical protein
MRSTSDTAAPKAKKTDCSPQPDVGSEQQDVDNGASEKSGALERRRVA